VTLRAPLRHDFVDRAYILDDILPTATATKRVRTLQGLRGPGLRAGDEAKRWNPWSSSDS
jgi:hypothetical protein